MTERLGMKLNLWILVGVLGTVAGLEAVETPVIRGGDKTVAVSMEIANAEEVKLTVTVGPDDYDWDQAVWGNPVFVMKDGTRLDATTGAMHARATRSAWCAAARGIRVRNSRRRPSAVRTVRTRRCMTSAFVLSSRNSGAENLIQEQNNYQKEMTR